MSVVAEKIKTKLKDRAVKSKEPKPAKEPKTKTPTKKAIRREAKEEKPMTKKEQEADHKAQGFAVIEPVKAKVKPHVDPAIGDSGVSRKVENMKGRMER